VNVASEEVHTRNLRIERSLRRQGWGIHRFSNLEVRTTPAADFEKLLLELPIPRGFSWVSAEEFEARLVDFDIPF